MIRQMIQNKDESEETSEKYNKLFKNMKKDQESSQKEIEELKGENRKLSKKMLAILQRREELEKQIKKVLN